MNDFVPRRRVEFIIVRTDMSVEELQRLIGIRADAVASRVDWVPPEASWELHAEGTESDDLSTLIAGVLNRVRQAGTGLVRACAEADAVLVRITQYAAESDPVGPGFALDSGDVALLSALNAAVDVDQYVI